MEVREFELRKVDTELREVEGIAVPYGVKTHINGFDELIERGAPEGDDIMLFWRHQEPIGKVIESKDTDEGYFIRAKISETPRGNEAYTLVRDGVIKKFSIGFEPVEHREDKDGTVVRTKINVKEVSLVPLPAYTDAAITQVRSEPEKENIVTDVISADELVEIRESVDNLERRMSTIVVNEAPAVDTRSAAEVLKSIASGNEERAYTGGTSADTVANSPWVGDLTRLIDNASVLGKVFATGSLPAEGGFFEYGQLKSNTSAVAKQVAEGDNLVFGKVQIEKKNVAKYTYGGYTQLTLQEIQRSTVNILNHSLNAQAIAAGVALGTAVRTDYAALVDANAANAVEAVAWTFADLVGAIVDAQVKFETNGLAIEAFVVTKGTYKALSTIVDADGLPVLRTSVGVGSLNITGLTASIAGIPVVMDAGLAAGKDALVNSQAIRVYRGPIAKFEDTNIINLSKDFSIAFDAAIADEIPAGVVPVTLPEE